MSVKLVLIKTDGTQITENNILSFTFRKEMYLAYTLLNARFMAENADLSNIAQVLFYADEKLIHHGLLDSARLTENQAGSFFTLSSRGFTSQLCQNQIEPGLVDNISVNTLMDGYYSLPFVTHEDNSDTSSYIYIKNNSTMWDGIVNLSCKLTGIYPYIRGTNCVRITDEQSPASFTYSNDTIIESGIDEDYKTILSHFHMSDINGDFGIYYLENQSALAHNIVRHKFFELDMQFLYNPQQALDYRSKYSSRASKCCYVKYSGYNGEDLSDVMSFGNLVNARICRIIIHGDGNGITTETGTFIDGFRPQ